MVETSVNVLGMSQLKRALRIIQDPYSRASLLNFVLSKVLQRGKPSDADSVVDLKAFWETAHIHQKQLWLTGSPPIEVIERLDVKSEIDRHDASILDVGVGLGLMARYLRDIGKEVDALDISSAALERVKPLVGSTFQDARDLPDNRYSLVMHHLVAQHMSDESLNDQIRHLVRSLRHDGVVALQFSSPLSDFRDRASKSSLSSQAGGVVVRTPDEMMALITDAGGRPLSVSPKESWRKYGSQYWVVKFS